MVIIPFKVNYVFKSSVLYLARNKCIMFYVMIFTNLSNNKLSGQRRFFVFLSLTTFYWNFSESTNIHHREIRKWKRKHMQSSFFVMIMT